MIDLMESIALQESVSEPSFAESQKIKPPLLRTIDLCKLLEVNDLATNMACRGNLELVLKGKLEFISNNLYYPSADNGTAAQ